ncbi:MAG: hypothetical protein HWN69_04655 [Desulfobacterales bacterium]|nr:hypothetical protein [Desulfobacterales bacterium]
MQRIIEHFCARDDLSTYDPYDIWKTKPGLYVKDLFNHNRYIGLFPAAVLALFDTFLNNRFRLFYSRQEYPIVRAIAALSLLNLYCKSREQRHLDFAKKHLQWLADHSCNGYNGYCWGLGFDYPVTSKVRYDRNTPFSTVTPYALEAFVQYSQIMRDKEYNNVIKGIYNFLENDIQVMEQSDDHLALSYGPMRDRIAINAVSYAMYSYALLLPYIPLKEREHVTNKIRKLYTYIRKNQSSDGSWLYSPEGHSFTDCFHSCFVMKNLLKTNSLMQLNRCPKVIAKGYTYVKKRLLDERYWLFKRFSLSNKPGITKFDLYDNAEMLNLAILLKDTSLIGRLVDSIRRHFCDGLDVYSQIDALGFRRNKNTLRWAVMPYLYALSKLLLSDVL